MKSIKPLILAVSVCVLASLATAAYYFLVRLPQNNATEAFRNGQAAMEGNNPLAAIDYYAAALGYSNRFTPARIALVNELMFLDPDEATELLDGFSAKPEADPALIGLNIRLALAKGELDTARELSLAPAFQDAPGLDADYARLLLLIEEQNFADGMAKLRDLLHAHPENRALKLVQATALNLSDSALDRVLAKDSLLRLTAKTDWISFEAALLLASPNRLPLAQDEMATAGRHLAKHPYLPQVLPRVPPEQLRAVVQRMVPHAMDAAYLVSKELTGRKDATSRDLAIHVEIVQALGLEPELRSLIDKLMSRADRTAEEHLILAKQFVMDGHFNDAIDLIGTVLSAGPENPAAYRLLAGLVSNKDLKLGEAAQIRAYRLLKDDPGGNPQTWLMAIEKLMELDALNRENYLEDAIDRFTGTQPGMLALWLATVGEQARALAVVPEPAALGNPDLLKIRFNALVGTGRLDDAFALLGKSAGLLDELDLAILLARYCRGKGERLDALSHLERALSMAARQEKLDYLLAIARTGRELEAPDLTRKAYDLAFAHAAPFSTPQASDYLQLLMRAGELEKASEFALFCRNLNPDNPFFVNNHCYLQAVRGRGLETCVNDMRKIVAQYPAVPNFKGTLALAELLDNQPAAALATMESQDSSMQMDSAQSKLVYALVFAANRNQAVAMSIVQGIDPGDLMEVERSLLERFGLVSNRN